MTAVIVKKENAKIAVLREIAEQNDGVLKPQDVVEAARDPRNVLHDYFEWDDDTAAEGFRLFQAGMLIRSVKLKIVIGDNKERAVNVQISRAFQSLPSLRKTGGGYLPLQTIVDDPKLKQELLDRVLKDLEILKKRYEGLEELADVWSAMESKVRAVKARRGRPPKAGSARLAR